MRRPSAGLDRAAACVRVLATGNAVRYLPPLPFALQGRRELSVLAKRALRGGPFPGRRQPNERSRDPQDSQLRERQPGSAGRLVAADGRPRQRGPESAGARHPCQQSSNRPLSDHLRRGTETMQRKVVFAILALVLVLGTFGALVLTACGSDGDTGARDESRASAQSPRRRASRSRSASTKASPASWPWTPTDRQGHQAGHRAARRPDRWAGPSSTSRPTTPPTRCRRSTRRASWWRATRSTSCSGRSSRRRTRR